jgi:hypothetical protein
MRRVNPYDRIELESRASYADTFYPTRKKEKISLATIGLASYTIISDFLISTLSANAEALL